MAESARTIPPPQSTRPAERPLQAERSVNVGDIERWLSVLGGGALALCTLRRSLGTLVLLAGAGALLSRGLTGHCALYQAMGVSTAAQAPDASRTLGATESEEAPRIEIVRS